MKIDQSVRADTGIARPRSGDAMATEPAMAGVGDARLRWFAVQTLAHMEATAEVHLARQGFESFLPRIKVTRRHARKIETVKTPLFPGYGFVRLDLSRHRWRSVNGTAGVAGLVMACDRPQPIPHGTVEGLQQATTAEGVVDLDHGLRPGDPVRLVAGPFAGQLGVLVRLDGKARVEMLLSLIGGSVRLKVARDALVPAH